MAAVTEASLDRGSRQIIQRYFLAMAAPFAIDVGTSAIYVLINDQPMTLLPMASVSALFLLLGVGVLGWMLIRPVQRFLAGELSFTQVEVGLASLPRNSAIVVGCLYTPMLALRLLSPRIGITFGATIELAAWIDTICTFLVVSAFNIVLTFFIVSVYLDRLCEFLFRTRRVNIGIFRGMFRRRIGLAVLFVSFAAMTLLAGDIASYDGDRLLREATNDLVASVIGAGITYFWITRALTGPIARLDHGMRQVAEGSLTARLPVTSDDEVGRATSGFNQMVEGLAEREYLRNTFGKYVSESVATAILGDHERRGRVDNTLAEATLMFTDIEGFTTLSETLTPADVASVLNTYLGTVVPAIERHGGVVNSFIGDGLFASFNLPLALEGHAAAAIRAAMEIERELAAKTFAAGVRLRTRIGINTGPVVGVTIGTENRLSYTLLGDAVNIASRVEQLNKQFGSLILATESTMRAAGDGFPCQRLGETGVRGHRGDVVVYRFDPA
jgi:class 3 adenylate cyclase